MVKAADELIKIQEYESIYLHKGGSPVYVYLLHFLLIILEAT